MCTRVNLPLATHSEMPLVMVPSSNGYSACCCDSVVSVLAFLSPARFSVRVAFDLRLTGSLIRIADF